MKLYQLKPGKTMLQIKNQPLTSISNRLYFCAFATPNISSKNFKIIHHPFVVKKEFGCYNEDIARSLHSDGLNLLLRLVVPELW